MRLDRDAIVFDRFGGLEPPEERWREDVPFWEEFTESLFRSNGLAYDAQRDGNIATFLTATDRAPFAAMVETLLPRLAARAPLADIDLVVLAHWLPDLHLGTSVTNFAMHALGLQDATGFAVSDRGLAAPLVALDMAARWAKPRGRALVMVMDQKHLLHRCPEVDALSPENAACLMLFDDFGTGDLGYAGYRRVPLAPGDDPREATLGLAHALALEPARTMLIAAPDLCVASERDFFVAPTDARHVCAAPFAVLAGLPPGDALIVVREADALCAVGFFDEGRRACA